MKASTWLQVSRNSVARLLLASALLVCISSPAPASPNEALDQKIHAAIQGFPGSVTLFAKNLDTGASFNLHGEDPVVTASTIKLPIMVELFAEAEEGKLDWNQKLTLTEQDKVPGSGVVTELSAGDALPIRDLMHLMIVVSDNSATNMILDRIGGDAVNARMEQLGLKQTAVMHKISGAKFPFAEGKKPGNERWGIGRSSPQEMVTIMEKLYRGELVSRNASAEMITVLKRQRDLDGVGRDTPDVVSASKAGALDHLRSDVAIVYASSGAVAMAVTVNGIPVVDYGPDNAGNVLIARLSQILVSGLASSPSGTR
jgi:beta-lactamase class A